MAPPQVATLDGDRLVAFHLARDSGVLHLSAKVLTNELLGALSDALLGTVARQNLPRKLRKVEIDGRSFQALLKHLRGTRTTLTSLTLQGRFQSNDVSWVPPSLEKLDLCYCRLSTSKISLFCDKLKDPLCVIKELKVRGNVFGDEGAHSIADMLRNNQSLEVLDVAGNLLSAKGMEEIFKSLEQNKSLLKLDISHNNLAEFLPTKNAVSQLCHGLSSGCRLKEVCLERTGIKPTGLVDLVAVLEHNSDIERVQLKGPNDRAFDPDDQDVVDKLEVLLGRNRAKGAHQA